MDDGLCHICRRPPLQVSLLYRITTCEDCEEPKAKEQQPMKLCKNCVFSGNSNMLDGWTCTRPRITDTTCPVTGDRRAKRVCCGRERAPHQWWRSKDRCGPEASFFMPSTEG